MNGWFCMFRGMEVANYFFFAFLFSLFEILLVRFSLEIKYFLHDFFRRHKSFKLIIVFAVFQKF